MSTFVHLAAVLFYSGVAVIIGLVLPLFVSGIDSDEAMTASGVILLACALIHEILVRQSHMSRLSTAMTLLHSAGTDVMGELSRARNEVRGIHDAISAAARKGSTSGELADDMEKVASEVKLLQRLVDQLSRSRAAPAPRAAVEPAPVPAAPAPAAPPPETPEAPEAPPVPPVTGKRELGPVAENLDDGAILQIIQDGLRMDRVDLVLQPIVSLPQRKPRFMEAFTRIRASDGTHIEPKQYIAIAEREGLITAIDNLLLLRCVQMLRNMRPRERNVGFFCNISPYTLADGGFFREFVQFMSENAELAPHLIFEFAQATITDDDEEIGRLTRRLADMGFRFSMDQVASLNLDFERLATQQFRFVKIEAEALVKDVGNPQAPLDAQVQGLKRTLGRHNIDLIVEKVETEQSLLELLDYHIDFGQGYLFGEPKQTRR